MAYQLEVIVDALNRATEVYGQHGSEFGQNKPDKVRAMIHFHQFQEKSEGKKTKENHQMYISNRLYGDEASLFLDLFQLSLGAIAAGQATASRATNEWQLTKAQFACSLSNSGVIFLSAPGLKQVVKRIGLEDMKEMRKKANEGGYDMLHACQQAPCVEGVPLPDVSDSVMPPAPVDIRDYSNNMLIRRMIQIACNKEVPERLRNHMPGLANSGDELEDVAVYTDVAYVVCAKDSTKSLLLGKDHAKLGAQLMLQRSADIVRFDDDHCGVLHAETPREEEDMELQAPQEVDGDGSVISGQEDWLDALEESSGPASNPPNSRDNEVSLAEQAATAAAKAADTAENACSSASKAYNRLLQTSSIKEIAGKSEPSTEGVCLDTLNGLMMKEILSICHSNQVAKRFCDWSKQLAIKVHDEFLKEVEGGAKDEAQRHCEHARQCYDRALEAVSGTHGDDETSSVDFERGQLTENLYSNKSHLGTEKILKLARSTAAVSEQTFNSFVQRQVEDVANLKKKIQNAELLHFRPEVADDDSVNEDDLPMKETLLEEEDSVEVHAKDVEASKLNESDLLGDAMREQQMAPLVQNSRGHESNSSDAYAYDFISGLTRSISTYPNTSICGVGNAHSGSPGAKRVEFSATTTFANLDVNGFDSGLCHRISHLPSDGMIGIQVYMEGLHQQQMKQDNSIWKDLLKLPILVAERLRSSRFSQKSRSQLSAIIQELDKVLPSIEKLSKERPGFGVRAEMFARVDGCIRSGGEANFPHVELFEFLMVSKGKLAEYESGQTESNFAPIRKTFAAEAANNKAGKCLDETLISPAAKTALVAHAELLAQQHGQSKLGYSGVILKSMGRQIAETGRVEVPHQFRVSLNDHEKRVCGLQHGVRPDTLILPTLLDVIGQQSWLDGSTRGRPLGMASAISLVRQRASSGRSGSDLPVTVENCVVAVKVVLNCFDVIGKMRHSLTSRSASASQKARANR